MRINTESTWPTQVNAQTAEAADFEVNPVINPKKLTALFVPGCQRRAGLFPGMLRTNWLNVAQTSIFFEISSIIPTSIAL